MIDLIFEKEPARYEIPFLEGLCERLYTSGKLLQCNGSHNDAAPCVVAVPYAIIFGRAVAVAGLCSISANFPICA